MTQQTQHEGFAAATERLDTALARLEASVKSLGNRMRSVAHVEAEMHKLASERTRLMSALDIANARAERIDEAAGDVSRRLVDAMETVKTVLESETHG